MERHTYEAVVLCLLVAVVGGAVLYRYHRGQPRFHPYMTVPLTGDVSVVRLDRVPPKVNVNIATAADLDTLPFITPAIAQSIVVYRTQHPFRDLAEFVRIAGVGEKRLETLAELVYCGPVTTSAVEHTHD
jgi:hypothetical protein